jgi:hypothetical protein
MSVVTVQQMADRVAALLEERLRVKGDTLEARLNRAGRRLPRKVRDAGAVLVQATQMIRNPKMMHLVDDETVALAYDTCLRHLNTVDPAEARKGLILDMAARIVGVLYWRGMV